MMVIACNSKGSFFLLLLFRCLSNGIVRVQNVKIKMVILGNGTTSCIIHTKAALLVHR